MQADMQEKIGTICTSCGASYPPGAKFCGIDGAALQAGGGTSSAPGVAAGKFCPRCRVTYPMYAQYCPSDATRLQVFTPGKTQGVPNHNGASPSVVPAAASFAAPATPAATAASAQYEFPDQADNTIVGKVFAGKYKIESLLGEGGMARVYKATHQSIEKPVVIKLMHPHISQRDIETSIKRFELEIKVSAKLNHPNLVSVYDGGVINNRPYLVMEYIKGQSLRQYSSEHGAIKFEDAITIVSQICAGLSEAHSQGIVHRDLKPENIMLREQSDRPDWVKIVDFGIAHLKLGGGNKLTATGVAIGTVDYMSPEYLSDKPIDQRADIYAVGVILFELLTGKCPFESESCEAVMAKHLWTTPMPPSSLRQGMAPGCRLDLIVERALAKEPEERFQTTAEMRAALEDARVANPVA